ncbi:MAG TPA: histidine kinase [Burkholderiaceae bacterium]|nr:histidine kinase [Burkholderiaceae bacterium]
MRALAISRRSPATAPAQLNWRRALSYGALWAIACATMESFALPLGDMNPVEWLEFNLRLMAHWLVAGIAPVGALLLLEPYLTPARFLPALLAFALIGTAAWSLYSMLQSLFPILKFLINSPAIASGSSMHVFWASLCYGGVFIAVYGMSQRGERTRALLAQAEIARQRSEAALGAAQLQALQGQVDPAFLLRVMTEIERRYAAAPATVESLLDALIGFLRAAMPGVRSGASTLAAEVLLAMQYARLVAALGPGRGVRAIRVDGTMPDLPFPPLLLLPVLDALAAAPGDGGTTLQIAQHEGRCNLTLARAGLSGNDAWLPPELLYRLQVGLRTWFGDAWTLTLHAGTGPAFTLTLPLTPPPAVPEPATPTRADAPRSHLETTHHD